MQRVVVPQLKDLAFDVSYKEIQGNLILCPDSRPEDKQLVWVSFSSFLSTIPYLKSQNMRQIIRDRLTQHFIEEKMNNKFRRKYLRRFLKSCLNSASYDQIPDIWVFLDCVLDKSILELETHAGFPQSEPNLNLIPTISKRSPFLEKLVIDFKLMVCHNVNPKAQVGIREREEMCMEKLIKPLISSLNSLQKLTSLSLYNLNGSSLLSLNGYSSVFSLLGKSCPSLSQLRVSGFSIRKRDILALILGEIIDDILPFDDVELSRFTGSDWFQDSELERLVVPSEFLTPLCFTLKDFQLKDIRNNSEYHPYYSACHDCYGISSSIVSFALRHLPSLENIHEGLPTSEAIKILKKSNVISITKTRIQAEFEYICREVHKHRFSTASSSSTVSYRFSGCLSLTNLFNINVLDANMLQAVGSICPLLKEATFCKIEPKFKPAATNYSFFKKEEPKKEVKVLSPVEFEAILRTWPKLETITITGLYMSSGYCKSILNVFGPGLRHLMLQACNEIDLADLASHCPGLETLRILGVYSSLTKKDIGSVLASGAFLPKLKIFQSHICLGNCSPLFEEKSSLVQLILNCSHMEMKDRHGRLIWATMRWENIPMVWSNMEIFRVQQCDGMTMDIFANLIPQFAKLKEMSLPERMTRPNERYNSRGVIDAEEAFNSIITNARSRSMKIQFKKDVNGYDSKCHLVESSRGGFQDKRIKDDGYGYYGYNY